MLFHTKTTLYVSLLELFIFFYQTQSLLTFQYVPFHHISNIHKKVSWKIPDKVDVYHNYICIENVVS